MNKSLLHDDQTDDEQRKVLIKYMSERTSWWTQSYNQFLKGLSNQRTSKQLKWKLEKFKIVLENEIWHTVDPVRYLMRLYYLKGLSSEEIIEKIKDKWLDYSSRWLRALFSDTFKWQLQEAGEDHPLKAERRKTTVQVDKLKDYNETVAGDNTKNFNRRLLKIIWEDESKPEYSSEIFDSFTWKRSEQMNKAWYLLECFENISSDTAINIAIETNLWARALARILDEKLKIIKKNLNITDKKLTVSVTYIWKKLRERKKKKTKSS